MADQLGITPIDSFALLLGRTGKAFKDVSTDVKNQMASGALVTSVEDNEVYAKGKNGEFFNIGDSRVAKQKAKDNVIIARPDKIVAIGTESEVTGAIKIKIPVNQPLMGKMRVEFLCHPKDGAISHSMSVTVVGHHNGTKWTEEKCSVQVATDSDDSIKIRYCTNSEGAYILIGDDDSKWYYTRVCITEVITNNISGADFSDESNWDILVEPSAEELDLEAIVYGSNAPKYRIFTDTDNGKRYKEYYENGTKKIEEL
jgi:hypothetical protein